MRVLKKLPIVLTLVLALGLTGCASSEPPSGEELKSAVTELEARGFTDPRWESHNKTFTVGVGKCRMPIREGAQDWTITITAPNANGVLPKIRGANLEILKDLPSIKACFEDGN